MKRRLNEMPRKVTEKIVDAFLNGRSAKQSNTETDGESLYLYGNEIAKIEDGELWITNAGWFSNTTKERLNALPGVGVHQKNFDWFLNDKPWDGKWTKIGKLSDLKDVWWRNENKFTRKTFANSTLRENYNRIVDAQNQRLDFGDRVLKESNDDDFSYLDKKYQSVIFKLQKLGIEVRSSEDYSDDRGLFWIDCESGSIDTKYHLDYYDNYWGSDKFNSILNSAGLMFEWDNPAYAVVFEE